MRTYELVLVFDSGLEVEQIETDLKRFKDIMISEGGFIRVWERWGKQRLAYEIRRRQYGYYTLVIFDTAPSVINELERIIRLTPTILRHLITVVDPSRAPEIDQESVETLGAARPGKLNAEETEVDSEAADVVDTESEAIDEDEEISSQAEDPEESAEAEEPVIASDEASEDDENKKTEDVA